MKGKNTAIIEIGQYLNNEVDDYELDLAKNRKRRQGPYVEVAQQNNMEVYGVSKELDTSKGEESIDGKKKILFYWQVLVPRPNRTYDCLKLELLRVRSPRAVPILRELTKTHKPNIIFLFETLVHSYKIEENRVKLSFDCYFTVDREDRSSGIGVLCYESI